MLKVVNLWAGPGAGKSTTSAHLFALMKARGHKVELIHEHAKDCVYAGHMDDLTDPLWIFANQARKQRRLEGQVDWCITDSPLPLCLAYENDPRLRPAIQARWDRYQNHDFFITRVKPYQAWGRRERTVDEARLKDRRVYEVALSFVSYPLQSVAGDEEAAETIYRALFPTTQAEEASQPQLNLDAPTFDAYRAHYGVPKEDPPDLSQYRRHQGVRRVTSDVEEVLQEAGLDDRTLFEAAWRSALD